MRIQSITFAILSSLALVACGGSSANLGDAKDPGGDPWKDYKGTYATAALPKGDADRPVKTAKAKAEPKPAPAPVKDEAEAAAEAALAEANAQPEPAMTEPAPAPTPKKAKGGAKKGKKGKK